MLVNSVLKTVINNITEQLNFQYDLYWLYYKLIFNFNLVKSVTKGTVFVECVSRFKPN